MRQRKRLSGTRKIKVSTTSLWCDVCYRQQNFVLLRSSPGSRIEKYKCPECRFVKEYHV